MTYNPYLDEPTKGEVEELAGRLNAPESVSDRLRKPMRVLLRHDRESAEKMLGAFQDLIDAYEERGKLISEFADEQRRERLEWDATL